MTTTGFTDSCPVEKPESTAENDLQPLKGELACVEVGMIVASHPADEAKQRLHQTEGMLPKDEVASVEASPDDSPLHQREGKEKALSNAEVDGKTLEEEDDSHESVESCNSAGLFLARKRPWSFEQQLVIGNKEAKKQIQESPRSASFCKQDSSFMNWISNMVKGLHKSNMDNTPLALTTRPYHVHENYNQDFTLHGKKQESGCTSTGFESVFKALYCPGMSVQEKKILCLDNQPEEGSKELELVGKTSDNSTTPASCGKEYNRLCKEVLIRTMNFNQITCVDGKGPSSLPNITTENIGILQGNQKTSTVENSNTSKIACGLEKGGVILSNSSFRNDSNSPSEGKEACGLSSIDPNKSLNSITNRSGLLGNLWINRFSPVVSGQMKSSSQCNQKEDAVVEGYNDCSKLHSHSQNCVVSVKEQYGWDSCAEDPMDVASKKVQNCVVNTTGSFGFKRTTRHTDQKFKSKLNSIQHSQRFKNSEAMVSVFARRLDALRHIIPSAAAGNSSPATTICFFCGSRDHELRVCSEITESEIEELLKNVHLFDGAVELSCLCIRCFQLNHWAIACPSTYSRKQSHLKNSSSVVNFQNFGKILTTSYDDTRTNNDERNPSENNDYGRQVGLTFCDGKKMRLDTEAMVGTNVGKLSGTMILNARVSDLKLDKKNLLRNYFCEGTSLKNTSREFMLNVKQADSNSTETESKENEAIPFCNFVNRQIPTVPRGTFEAIRRLRLSRTDILKWAQSQVSLFCLEGFFLRLRLCKQEERLGGTGYYVARINGSLRERSSGSSKIPVSVDIGSFKCLVESRFVSNHDFIEDELVSWWCATLRGGGKLPSEEHLKLKLEERRNFGL